MNMLMPLLLLAARCAWSENLVRVFYKPDGKIIVGVANRELCEKGEGEASCVQRVTDRFCPRDDSGACLPSTIMESATLPPRAKRDKWRGRKSTGVRVDESVVTRTERIAQAEAALDAELGKPAPEPVKVISLHRALEKERAKPVTD